jgi:hypothetical protein
MRATALRPIAGEHHIATSARLTKRRVAVVELNAMAGSAFPSEVRLAQRRAAGARKRPSHPDVAEDLGSTRKKS